MEFTKLKIDQYRVNSREIIENIVIVLNSQTNRGFFVPITINYNKLPSALIKFLKQIGYLEENLAGTFNGNYNILSLGDLEYKEESKMLLKNFIKEVRELMSNQTKHNVRYDFPGAFIFTYLIEVKDKEEETLIRSKKTFINELEKLFLKLLDKLDLIYAVPFLYKKITLVKNEEIYLNLKIDFLADKCCLHLNINENYFEKQAIEIFKNKLSTIEKLVNELYKKAQLESHFRLLSNFEFMDKLLLNKGNYQKYGFNNAIEMCFMLFLMEKHSLFENKCNLDIVSFTIDYEKSIEIQKPKNDSFSMPERFFIGYGQFTSEHIKNICLQVENDKFIHSRSMGLDFTKLLSISTPH